MLCDVTLLLKLSFRLVFLCKAAVLVGLSPPLGTHGGLKCEFTWREREICKRWSQLLVDVSDKVWCVLWGAYLCSEALTTAINDAKEWFGANVAGNVLGEPVARARHGSEDFATSPTTTYTGRLRYVLVLRRRKSWLLLVGFLSTHLEMIEQLLRLKTIPATFPLAGHL